MTPMQLGTLSEIEIFKMSVVAGVFLGIIYIAFAAAWGLVPFKAVRFICDFIYALLFGAVFFTFSLSQTSYLRCIFLVGMLLGAAMWHFTLGRRLAKLLTALLCFVRDKFLLLPLKLLHKISRRIVRRFMKNAQFLKNRKIYRKTT